MRPGSAAARVLLAGALALHAPAFAAAFDLAGLMQLLRAERPAHARFHETRFLALLERPLESSGELVFTPPDRLEKRTTSPGAERLVAQGDRVTIERAGRTETVSLAQYPQVGVLVESIRGTLAGDRAALERAYTIALAGEAKAWRMTLRPRDAEVAKLVERVTIAGSAGVVQRIEIDQADGDRSLMQITPRRP